MHGSAPGIEARLRDCEAALAALARRISSLEDAAGAVVAPHDPILGSRAAPPSADPTWPPIPAVDYAGILSLAGRTCVVLGGAFLLRALTDAGTLPIGGGVVLGFVYAALWLVVADYSGRRRPASGLVHGLTAVLIGWPLLWEASFRFHLLSPPAGALALAGLTTLALVVAWHRDLQGLAGVATCGAVVTAIALAFASGVILPNVIFLIALSWASSWLSETRHWGWLKWPASLAASLWMAVAAGRAGGVSLTLVGALAYGVAFFLHTRRPHARSAFYYYATIGLVMMAWGIGLALAGVTRDVTFTALAVSSWWLGTRTPQPVLATHSVVYAAAAAISAGLVVCFWQVWLTPIALWPTIPLTGWLVLIAAVPGALIPRAAGSSHPGLMLSISRLALAVMLLGGLAGLIVLLLGPAVAGTPPDPGRLASLKTVILACAAVALTLVRRLPSGIELGRLAYPVLIAGGLKLLVEDLRVSAPSTLFVALAAYGMALLLTARIGRQRTRA